MTRALASLLLAVILAVPAVGATAASDPWKALQRGDYAAAEAAWLPLAERGEVAAQVFLGHLESMRDRHEAAAKWYRRAAAKGNVEAQVLLATQYLRGRGVPRDLVRAYAWYDLAATAGLTNAARARDMATRQMSESEVAAARKLSKTWIAAGPPAEAD
ncbi:MAG: tetratricopeptide repeat protein [Alphaproteobacteria bacterium]|jgi:TPR repeat protein|nr:tetratricopeptide repeat protein [Alphaproteobacteria bacterium]MDP6517296.1 tetratricopeptide repeat protein [Alphaproteobacteria bacterium]